METTVTPTRKPSDLTEAETIALTEMLATELLVTLDERLVEELDLEEPEYGTDPAAEPIIALVLKAMAHQAGV